AHLLQVPPSELRVHDHSTGSPGDVRRPWGAERLAPHCVGGPPPLAVPHGLAGGLTSNPIALGDHPLHEVVEGEVVDHDEAGDPDGVTVDVAVELDVVAEVVDAQRVPRKSPLVSAGRRPQDLDLEALGESDTVEAVED